MVFAILFFIVGLIILIKGANWLVDGASSLALRFNINPMIIGLTVVAFGTSSPELVVSVGSALTGNTEIALGNIIGSNIANILLILGTSAMVYPLSVHKNTVWKEIPMSFLGAIVMTILGLQVLIDEPTLTHFAFDQTVIGSLTFSNGLILLSFFIIFLYYTFGAAKVKAETPPMQQSPLSKTIIFITVGLGGLLLGSKLLVDNAVFIATSLGISQTIIGLTMVAIGTSLPELVTSIIAATKKQVELAVGNVVGSNIFNIFLILGVTSLIKPIPLSTSTLIDIFVLFLATFLLFITLFVNKKRLITRKEGAVMLGIYLLYILLLIIRV